MPTSTLRPATAPAPTTASARIEPRPLDPSELEPAATAAFGRALRADLRLRRYVEGLDLLSVVGPAHIQFVASYLAGRIGAAPDGSPYRDEDLPLVLEHLAAAGVPAVDVDQLHSDRPRPVPTTSRP